MDTNYTQLLLFFQVGMSFLVYGLVARWYVSPALAKRPVIQALSPILLFHAMRHIGLVFVISSVVDANLPRSFSLPGTVGDLLAMFLALVALWALRSKSGLALSLLWVFNIIGTLDFMNAFYQGVATQVVNFHLGVAWFIPTVLVPAYFMTHILVFIILLTRAGEIRRLKTTQNIPLPPSTANESSESPFMSKGQRTMKTTSKTQDGAQSDAIPQHMQHYVAGDIDAAGGSPPDPTHQSTMPDKKARYNL